MGEQFQWPSSPGEWMAISLAVGLVLVGAVDLWLFVVRGEAATISAVVRDQAHRHPVIPLAVGLLVGHLFL